MPPDARGGQAPALPPLLGGGRRRLFARLAATGALHAVLVVLVALAGRHGLDRVGNAGGLGTVELAAVLAALAVGALLAHLARVRERTIAETLAQDYATAARLRLFDHLNAVAPGDLRRRSRGVLMVRFVADLNALTDWVALGLGRIAVAGPASGVALVAMAWVNPTVAVGLALGLLVLALLLIAPGAALRARVREARRRRGRLAANLGDKLTAGSPVQVLARTDGERDRLLRHSRRLSEAMVHQRRLASHLGFLPDAAVPLATGLLLLASLGPAALTTGDLLATLVILGLLAAPLGDIARGFVLWQDFRVARDVLNRFLAVPAMPGAGGCLRAEGGEITLAGVTVTGCFADVAAAAPRRTLVAVTGPSGGGKSTLLALLARLRDPDAGEVRVDGQDLAACRPGSVRRAVSLLSPDLPLLRGSVRRNLTYRRRDAAPAEIRAAIEACGLAPAVAALPRGLDSRIAEAGADLPGGTRQRLQVARAVLDDPAVLLVDDADRFQDPEARRAIHRLAGERRRTTVLVTRDPRLLEMADVIWQLEGGALRTVARRPPPAAGAAVVQLRASHSPGPVDRRCASAPGSS